MTYAEGIKELRKKLILTQTEFAELLGVSFQSINRWYKGKNVYYQLYRRYILFEKRSHK